jgi:hypothetical protein
MAACRRIVCGVSDCVLWRRRTILDVAVRDKRLLSNPARGVNLPRKVGRAHTYLTHEQVAATHEQVAAVAREAGDRSTLVLVLAYTGLRWGRRSACA